MLRCRIPWRKPSRLVLFSSSASNNEEKTNLQQQNEVKTTWNTLLVGEIVDIQPHPQADRLSICAVNIGEESVLQIICGAANVHRGARVPVATIGTQLAIKEPTTGELKKLKIKKSKLRGEVSEGMICSEAELGLADKSDGILILDDTAKAGGLVCKIGIIASQLTARKQLDG